MNSNEVASTSNDKPSTIQITFNRRLPTSLKTITSIHAEESKAVLQSLRKTKDWKVRTLKGIVEHKNQPTQQLLAPLKNLKALSTLDLKFASANTKIAKTIVSALKHFSRLTAVSLDYSYCPQFGEHDFQSLCHTLESIPSLLKLELDFSNNKQIKNEALERLNHILKRSPKLSVLRLNLS